MRGTVCLLFILVVALLQNVLSASNNAFQPMIGAVVSAVNTPTCLLVTSQHGYVSCLSQSSGELSWRLKIGDNVSSVLSYVAHDGLVLLATLNNKRIMISGVTIDSGFIQWEFSLEGPYESQFELSSQFDARNKLWYLLVDNTSIYVVDVANKSQHGTFKFPDTKLRLDKISLNAKNQIVTAGCLLTSASPAICQHNVLMTLPIQAGQPMTSKDIANAKFSVFSEVQKLGEYQLFQSSQGPGIVSSSKKLSADGNELTLSLAYLFVEEGKIHTCSKVVDLSQFDDKRFSIEVLTVKESVTLLILVEHSAGSTTIQYKLDYVQNTLLEGPTKKCRNCNIIVVKDYSLTNVQNLESFQLVETQHIYHESMQLSTSAIVKLELGHYLLAFKNGLTFLVDGQNLHKVMWHRYDGLSNIKQAVALGITTEIGETDEGNQGVLHSLTKLVTNENAIKIAPAVVGISFHGDERSMFQNGLNWCDMQATLVTALMDPNMKQTLETVREYTLKIDHKITCPLVRSLRFVPKNEALGPHEGGKHWDSVLLLLDTFDAGVFFYDVALFITQGKGVNFDKTSADYTFSVENLFPIAQRDDIGIVLSVTPDINKIGRRQKVVTGVRILTEQSGKHQLSYISFLKEFHESKQIDNHIFSNITAGSVTIFKGSRLNSCGESHIGKYDLVCSAAFPSSTIKFDPEEEKIASIANYHYEDEMVNRASATGDDNVLLKYSNPQLLVVNTVTNLRTQDTAELQDSKLYVNLIDGISGKLFQRVVHDNAVGPINSIVIENFVIVGYWNSKVKRSEISVIGLYDGIIGKYDFTPVSSKSSQARKEFDSSIEDKGERIIYKSAYATSIPLSIQKTYTIPGKILQFGQTSSMRSITNKNLIVMLDSGNAFSIDLRMIHPRRPLSDPTPGEKEEGLARYHPVLPLLPFSSVTKLHSVAHGAAKILSVPSSYESRCFILICGYGSDVFFGTITPSNGFDTLAADFNHPALIALIGGLAIAVLTLRSLFLSTSLKRIWT